MRHPDYLAREMFNIELGDRALYYEAFPEDHETITLCCLDAEIIRRQEATP